MNNIAYFTGKLYPDKSFSIGYVKKPQKRQAEEEYDKTFEGQYDSYEYTVEEDGRTIRKEHKFFDGEVDLDRFIKRAESSREPKTYGKKGITLYGKRNLRNIPILLQEKFGRKRLGFYTATLPVLSEHALKFILDKWGEVVRRFFQKITRLYKKKKVEFFYTSCTEIQEGRYASYGMAYPHLHWVAVCKERARGKFVISAHEVRVAWMQSVLEGLHGCNGGYPVCMDAYMASIDAQVVKKSAAAYLGKYVSKGVKVVNKMIEDGYERFPRQWWSASKNCKHMFKASIVRLDCDTAMNLFYGLDDYLESGLLDYGDRIYVSIGVEGKEVCMGCHGRMSDKFMKILGARADGVLHLGSAA